MTYKIRPFAAVISVFLLAVVVRTDDPVDRWRVFGTLGLAFYLLAISWEVRI